VRLNSTVVHVAHDGEPGRAKEVVTSYVRGGKTYAVRSRAVVMACWNMFIPYLVPDLPEAHLALGFSRYYGDNDFEGALKEFEIAQRGLPNESEGYLALGAIQRRQGKWAESTANLEKAVSLNPKDSWVLQNLAFNYQMVRDFNAANKTVDRGLEVNPSALGLWEAKSKLAMAEKGDMSVAKKACEAAKSMPLGNDVKLRIAGAKADLFLLERKYKEGLDEAESISDDLLAPIPAALCGKYYLIGYARKALHDEAGARTAFLKAKELTEGQLKQSPDAPELHIQLAKILAYLGEKDAALAEARRASPRYRQGKNSLRDPEQACRPQRAGSPLSGVWKMFGRRSDCGRRPTRAHRARARPLLGMAVGRRPGRGGRPRDVPQLQPAA